MPGLFVTSHAEFAYKVATISWNPLYDAFAHAPTSKADVFANVFFFLPFGFLGYYALSRLNGKKAQSILFITCIGFLLSALVETLQLFTIDRTTSVSDVISNTLGTLAGALCASNIQTEYIHRFFNRHCARFTHSRMTFPLLVILGITVIAALTPFNFEFSRKSVLPKIPLFLHHFHQPQAAATAEDAVPVVFYTLLSSMFLVCFRDWKFRHPGSMTICMTLATGILLESGKFFIGNRTPSLYNVAGILLGCCAGILIVRFWSKFASKTTAWILTLAGIVLLVLLSLGGPAQHFPNLYTVMTAKKITTYGALSELADVTQLLMLFIPVGFILTLLSRKKNTKILWGLLIGLVPIIACSMELIMSGTLQREYFRTILSASETGVMFGAFISSTGWRLFSCYVHRAERDR
jgi:glycopeptide antibiotics resistance protein